MNFERATPAIAALLLAVTWTRQSFAYRPFDGTDADVAAPREFELEAGPLGYEREGREHFLVGPALVLNYGLAPRFEAVLEGRQQRALDHLRDSQTKDVALSLKSLLREGELQERSGASVALETGLLMPGSEGRLGAHIGSILSWRWSVCTLHLNLGNDILIPIHYGAIATLILEGPDRWRVRPVAEVLLERDFGRPRLTGGLERSVLIGAIAPYNEFWSFDLALRHAVFDGAQVDEARLGFTWSLSTGSR